MKQTRGPSTVSLAQAPLLATKLFVPRLRQGLVARARLGQRLGAALERPLTLVSAPAGYGKTTLVAEWLGGAGLPVAWLTLDEGDNEPGRFLSYLVAALQSIAPDLGRATADLLTLAELPPLATLLAPLVNDLASADPFVLVLDDYHALRAPPVHEVVELLVEHQPPSLHLVLLTRRDPPLPLARLRARGQLAEVRGDDLRFTTQEAGEFFARTMGLALGQPAVAALTQRTEGWIAGLQLAALSLQGREDVAEFLAAFSGSDRYVIDYLMEEVLRQQPQATRDFVRATAVLDRFCAPLCDAVTGRRDSKSLLEQLERANLFLIPLDASREWFRYHNLFADVLRAEHDEESRRAVHARAMAWLAQHGHLPEAIRHAQAAGDVPAAAALVRRAADGAFARGEFKTLVRWLEGLPVELVRQDADLASYQAWVLMLTGRLAAAGELVAEILRALPPEASDSIHARLLALRAWLARDRDYAAGEAFALAALQLLSESEPLWRLLALLPLGHTQLRQGKTAAATRSLSEAHGLGQRLGLPLAELAPLASLAPNLNRQGRRREAELLCRQTLAAHVDGRGRPLPLAGTIYVPLALLCYEADELDQAYDYIVKGLELCRQAAVDLQMLGDGEWTLARIQLARGESEQALATMRAARLRAERAGFGWQAAVLAGLEADFALRLGDVAAAARWAEESSLSPTQTPDPAQEIIYCTLARLLLAQGRAAEARELLDKLAAAAKQAERHGRLITINILAALAERALGRPEAAREQLAAAVRLAAPEDYRRAFLDEGPAVAELLPGASAAAPAFVAQLLASFARGAGPRPTPATAAAPARAGLAGQGQGLVEPLSERELEILRLIAAGRANAEIAAALVITLGTAKWHAFNIYGKLGVRSRTQAIARARELGLV
ncbi:MAG: LuxR C-terminal-related transcriptional regulator [Chloroflexota bacterium]